MDIDKNPSKKNVNIDQQKMLSNPRKNKRVFLHGITLFNFVR